MSLCCLIRLHTCIFSGQMTQTQQGGPQLLIFIVSCSLFPSSNQEWCQKNIQVEQLSKLRSLSLSKLQILRILFIYSVYNSCCPLQLLSQKNGFICLFCTVLCAYITVFNNNLQIFRHVIFLLIILFKKWCIWEFKIFLVSPFSHLKSFHADCQDPLDPNGNITVTFDVLSYVPNGYMVSVATINWQS